MGQVAVGDLCEYAPDQSIRLQELPEHVRQKGAIGWALCVLSVLGNPAKICYFTYIAYCAKYSVIVNALQSKRKGAKTPVRPSIAAIPVTASCRFRLERCHAASSFVPKCALTSVVARGNGGCPELKLAAVQIRCRLRGRLN